MMHTSKNTLMVFVGTAILAGVAACMFIYNCFDRNEFSFDTHDEHNEDYL